MRAVFALAMAIQRKCMIGKLKSLLSGDPTLPILDLGITKLFHPAAVQADQVIVMGSLVELKDRLTRLKMAARENSSLLKLGQDAIHGGQANIDGLGQQCPIDILGREMPCTRPMKNIQNLQPGRSDLQAGCF